MRSSVLSGWAASSTASSCWFSRCWSQSCLSFSRNCWFSSNYRQNPITQHPATNMRRPNHRCQPQCSQTRLTSMTINSRAFSNSCCSYGEWINFIIIIQWSNPKEKGLLTGLFHGSMTAYDSCLTLSVHLSVIERETFSIFAFSNWSVQAFVWLLPRRRAFASTGKLFNFEMYESLNRLFDDVWKLSVNEAIITLYLLIHSKERCFLAVNDCHINYAPIVHREPSHGSSSENGWSSNENRLLSSNLSQDAENVKARHDANICWQCGESFIERCWSVRLRIHFRSLHLDSSDSRWLSLNAICFVIFIHLSPDFNIDLAPPARTRSMLNLLFNLAGSEICCCRWRCRTLAENRADTNRIIESLVHSEV